MADVLNFDQKAHRYTVSGRHIPSVTQILESYSDYGAVDAQVLQRAADFGTAVHLATELDDLGTLDEKTLDPALVPYLQAWRLFRSTTGFEPIEVEQRLYAKVYGYEIAGTLDRVGMMHPAFTGVRHSRLKAKPQLACVDIKSGTVIPKTTGLQVAAYSEAYRAVSGKKIRARYCCQLRGDGMFNLVTLDDSSDFSTFLAMLQVHNWRLKNA